jgi:hypothetical protein
MFGDFDIGNKNTSKTCWEILILVKKKIGKTCWGIESLKLRSCVNINP